MLKKNARCDKPQRKEKGNALYETAQGKNFQTDYFGSVIEISGDFFSTSPLWHAPL